MHRLLSLYSANSGRKKSQKKQPKTVQTFQLKHLKNIHSWLSNRRDNIDLVLKFWNHKCMVRKLTLAIVTCPTSSYKFDSNPKSFCLSRIFRKQETNKGQLISRNRQENEPGSYATAEKSLPTEKSLRSNAASQ